MNRAEIANWETANEKNGYTPTRSKPAEPVVMLVHDHGVYLMSNGKPRDTIKRMSPNGEREIESAFCAYAKGCNPATDEEWYDTAHGLVGGDDFGEYLPWARQMQEAIKAGAKTITLNFTQRGITMSAPARKKAAAQ